MPELSAVYPWLRPDYRPRSAEKEMVTIAMTIEQAKAAMRAMDEVEGMRQEEWDGIQLNFLSGAWLAINKAVERAK